MHTYAAVVVVCPLSNTVNNSLLHNIKNLKVSNMDNGQAIFTIFRKMPVNLFYMVFKISNYTPNESQCVSDNSTDLVE